MNRNNNYFGVGKLDADYPVRRTKEQPKVNGKRSRKMVWECPYFRTWFNMLRRCYDQKYQEKQPTYTGAKVCEEWLTFSNFKSWMEKQDWDGKHLDKDLLGNGKLYSPDTCCFLSRQVNNFLLGSDASRGKLPKGVTLYRGRYIARVSNASNTSKYLGSYGCVTAAEIAYKKGKLDLAVALAANIKDERVSSALIRKFSFGNSRTMPRTFG